MFKIFDNMNVTTIISLDLARVFSSLILVFRWVNGRKSNN